MIDSDEPSSDDEPTEEPPPLAPRTNENKGLKRTATSKKKEKKSSKTNEGKGISSLNSFYFPGKKAFDGWTKFQLVTALVRDGQAIRDENYISVSILQSFAEAVFMDRPPPPKPTPYTQEEQTLRHTAALTIQNAYFTWMISALQTHDEQGAGHGGGQGLGPSDGSHNMHDDILAAMHSSDAHSGGVNQPNLPTRNSFTRQASVEDSIDLDTGMRGDLEIQRQMDEDNDSSAVQNSILEEEFIPPSLEYATLYADYNHPRLGGLGGKVMPWLRTSTGTPPFHAPYTCLSILSILSLCPSLSLCLSVSLSLPLHLRLHLYLWCRCSNSVVSCCIMLNCLLRCLYV